MMSTSTEDLESSSGAESPKSPPAQPIVEIPSSLATHVLGETESVLGDGTLSTVVIQPPAHTGNPLPPFYGTNDMPVITLSVGKAAFPLYKTTLFGTLADDERVYLFAPELGGPLSGYVKIVLPDGVKEPGSELAELQAKFEQVLIDQGLLKAGMAAAADKLEKSDSVSVAQRIRERAASLLSRNSPSNSSPPAETSGAQTVAAKARGFSTAVTSAASHAGAWVADHLVPSASTQTEGIAPRATTDETTEGDTSVGSAESNTMRGDGADVENVGVGHPAVLSTSASGTKGAVGAPTKVQDEQDVEFSLDDEETWRDVSI